MLANMDDSPFQDNFFSNNSFSTFIEFSKCHGKRFRLNNNFFFNSLILAACLLVIT